MTNTLIEATFRVSEDHLKQMVLDKEHLPSELREFAPLRERVLDNATMAENGFPGNSLGKFEEMGRITGYVREFASPSESPPTEAGANLVAATVVHLFRDVQAVSQWMREGFLQQFEENVGKPMGEEQELIAVEPVGINGLYDEVVALRATHSGPDGILSSTIADFRLGRLLGVAYVVTVGDVERTPLVESLAVELERQMVRMVLSSP